MVTFYLLSGAASLLLVERYRRFAVRNRIIDVPNARSSHGMATARGGGVVFIALWLCILIIMNEIGLVGSSLFLALFFPVLMVTLISCMDDVFNINMIYRLTTHFVASMLAVSLLWPLDINVYHCLLPHSLFLACALILYLSWSVNAYNFLDGLDGLAAFHCIFVCTVSSVLLFHCNDTTLAQLHMFLAVVVLGFLIWNWPRAKIFMGDSGSASLGLLLPLMSLQAQRNGGVDCSLLLMLYLPFLFDTTVTLLRRMCAGHVWYQAHKQHAFQRLHQCGWTHQQVLCGLVVVDGLVGTLVMFSAIFPQLTVIFSVLELMMLLLIYVLIERLVPMALS